MTRSLLRCERGNSFIELALAAPLLISLLVGMVDISRAVSAKLQVVQVTQRTIERVQRTNFQVADLTVLETEAEAAAGGGANATVSAWLECGSSTTKLAYTSSCATGEAYARFVGIEMTKNFTPMFSTKFFPGAVNGQVPLTGKAGVRVQ